MELVFRQYWDAQSGCWEANFIFPPVQQALLTMVHLSISLELVLIWIH